MSILLLCTYNVFVYMPMIYVLFISLLSQLPISYSSLVAHSSPFDAQTKSVKQTQNIVL